MLFWSSVGFVVPIFLIDVLIRFRRSFDEGSHSFEPTTSEISRLLLRTLAVCFCGLRRIVVHKATQFVAV